MSGVDNMNYMYSINATNGQMPLIVNFDVATDPNIDQILTQMRQTQAASQLPADVNKLGVTVRKSLSAPLMLIASVFAERHLRRELPRQLRLHQPE